MGMTRRVADNPPHFLLSSSPGFKYPPRGNSAERHRQDANNAERRHTSRDSVRRFRWSALAVGHGVGHGSRRRFAMGIVDFRRS